MKDERILLDRFEKYITVNKPSKEFVDIQRMNLDYWAVDNYMRFKENNKFAIRDAYHRNLSKWQSIQDSLLSVHPLDNQKALSVPSYTSLITNFLLREKEHLWNQESQNKTAFYKEWYNEDETNGREEYASDNSNLLREKIINKYFKDRTAEYLYVYLITNANAESNPKNLVSIYNRFKDKYVNSTYHPMLKPIVEGIKARQQKPLNERMVFVDSTGTKFNSFNDLLMLAKGKTVLVDMWGTWCTPCREEIEKNSADIKKHFKQKDLQYFYVANYDTENTKSWKALIAYFNLEGIHILANTQLTEDIMKLVKGSGYPTYFVIKKDGTYELSKAGYPMDREKLIKQLEESLSM